MSLVKIRSLVLIVVSSFVAVFILMGLMQMAPVLALEQTGADPARQIMPAQPPPPDIWVTIVFTDPSLTQITDLNGNDVREGVHIGMARCNRTNCNQKSTLAFSIPLTDWISIDYKFTTRQALDPEARRAVLTGTGIGTRVSDKQKDKFSFTATMQDNGNGTIKVIYEASRPDASFIIPASAGRMTFQ